MVERNRFEFDKEWIKPLLDGFWEPTISTCYGDVRYRKWVDHILCPRKKIQDGAILVPESAGSLYIGIAVTPNNWHYCWQVITLGGMTAKRLDVKIDEPFESVIESAKRAAIYRMNTDKNG